MKYIPKEKLSKKAKRLLANKQRTTWEGFQPITKKLKNKKVYDRKKIRQDENFSPDFYWCYNI